MIQKLVYSLILVLLFATAFGQSEKIFIFNEHQLHIEFNNNWTNDDLIAAKSKLSEKDIILIYDRLEFDKNGNLNIIDATIEYPDDTKASFTSRQLSDGAGPFFKRDFNKHPLKE